MKKKDKPFISVIVPIYNESENVKEFLEYLNSFMNKMRDDGFCKDFEIIVINDGSEDNSWDIIKDICFRNTKIKGLSFDKNRGKEIALLAGFIYSKGNAVISIDADFQHPIDVIREMLILYNNSEYQMIEAVKKSHVVRKGFIYEFLLRILEFLISEDIGKTSDFRLVDRDIVSRFISVFTPFRINRLLLDLICNDKGIIEIQVEKRKKGKSKFNFYKLLKLGIAAIYVKRSIFFNIFFISIGLFLIFIKSIIFRSLGVFFLITYLLYLSRSFCRPAFVIKDKVNL